MGVLFASGLQLTEAVQHTLGWLLVGLSVLLAVAYILVERRMESAAMASGGGDTNVNYGTQGIGINRGNINISAPQPSVHAEGLAYNEPSGDYFLTRARFTLDAPYAAQALHLKASGTCIKSFDVRPVPGGIMYLNQSQITSQGGVLSVTAPLGSTYEATVVTEKPDDVKIGVQLDQ